MSTIILGVETYNAVYRKLESYQYCREVGIDYCPMFRAMGNSELRKFVKELLYLNQKSYCTNYGCEVESSDVMLSFSSEGKDISTVQLFKYLSCIAYNIDSCYAHTSCYKKLMEALSELSITIVTSLDEFKAARWA